MRLRKSSKWLLLLALVAFASVLHDFPSADAAKKGKKKGETSSLHQSSSRHKYSRTKGKKYSSNSSSSSASASVELGDKVSGVNVNGSGGGGASSSLKQGSSATNYSKVFKKGPLKSSSSSNSSGSGSYHVSKKGSSSSKSKSKSSSKLTIITPSPVTTTSTTTTPEPMTVRTTPTTERLTTTRRITSPKTGKSRTKLSFGLGHESGIHSSSWVGIGANGAGITVGDLGGLSSSASTYFAGGNKDYRPLERGGLYADGLDLDFAKVYPEEVTEIPMVTTNTNGFNPVGVVGTINHDQPTHNYETLMMTGRVDELEKKARDHY
ncbi:unnamed protein product [Orchesella dallaii]|uniref:Uncharacterized protein n=1 Tax=Orchesella dallaii TaxID=48710 RepID=A0ABP1RC19_9HEXA